MQKTAALLLSIAFTPHILWLWFCIPSHLDSDILNHHIALSCTSVDPLDFILIYRVFLAIKTYSDGPEILYSHLILIFHNSTDI